MNTNVITLEMTVTLLISDELLKSISDTEGTGPGNPAALNDFISDNTFPNHSRCTKSAIITNVKRNATWGDL